MTAQADVKLEIKVTGLGIEKKLPIEFTHTVTPEEVFGPVYVVIGNSAMNLNTGGIADTDVLGILIIARANKCYLLINDSGSGTPASSGNQVLDGDNDEACYINLTGGLGSSKYIRILGDNANSAIEYLVFGKHT